MNIPDKLLYTNDHEWAGNDDGVVTIGITDFAQGELGDIIFVELPAVGQTFDSGDPFGTIEAVKTVADLYAPLGGEVVAVNEKLEESPQDINSDPYGAGWIVRIKLADAGELDQLLTADKYEELLD